MSTTNSEKSLILFGNKLSPCVRSVLLLAEAINVNLKFQYVDLAKCEHTTNSYLEKNPVHSVPVLETENGYIIDSHAILTYLITKYAKDDSLYPKDPFKRAMVDQRLHFDSGILYIRLRNISMTIYTTNDTEIAQDKIDSVYEGFEFMEKFLEKNLYLAGDYLTVADLCCICNVMSCEGFAPVKKNRFPKLFDWIARITSLSYYEKGNGIDNRLYVQFLKDCLGKKILG